jgi:Rrf2 family protein
VGVAEPFVVQVLGSLVAAGILDGVKGPQGGYRLTQRPERITVLEVVEAVHGPIRGEAADMGQGEAATFNKRLQAECAKIAELVRRHLRKVTIAELVSKGK